MCTLSFDAVARMTKSAAFALTACATLALCPASYAQSYLPSVKIGTAALIGTDTADNFYNSQPNASGHTDQLQAITGTATPRPVEIVELARALKNNPDLIYEYVRNNIEVVWMYGLQKGALGAAIDKSGTPFDQAMLMVELLRQAGYTASYQAGTIALSGSQFYDWTGISNAQAACQLLSSGGIPAQVNGSTLADCSYGAGATVSSVTLSHIWVAATINGGTYLFDPGYKPHGWKNGIDLAAATGLTSGTPLSQATGGMDSGTTSGASYVHNLNTEALNSTLQTYSSNLLSYLQSHNLQGAEMEDIVGGGQITPFATPTGGLRQNALPYTAVVQHSWTGGIPDPYRTSLAVAAATQNGNTIVGSDYAYDPAFNVTFYVDEIYGRRLTVDTDLGSQATCDQNSGNGCQNTIYLNLDGQTLATHVNPAIFYTSNQNTINACYAHNPLPDLCSLISPNTYGSARGMPATITLTAHHPYAASADGTNTTHGDYMSASLTKSVYLITPLTIVSGWGDTSGNLLNKWSNEVLADKDAPRLPATQDSNGETILSHLGPGQGDFTRTKTAASFLAQYTQAAHLNASIAGAVVQLHHALGVVYSDANINPTLTQTLSICGILNTSTTEHGGTTTTADFDACKKFAYGNPSYTISDSFDRIDVDANISVTSKVADPVARRAGILSIAASSAALEGSISQQMADLPDTTSTATRFAWGNRPPSSEDPSGGGPRSFYQFDSTNASNAQNLLRTENQESNNCAYGSGPNYAQSTEQPCPSGNFKAAVAYEIGAYAQAGFTVVSSQETFLGPGQRGGGYWPDSFNTYDYFATKQRGGAFVATRYVGDDPVEIAHIVSGLNPSGGSVFTKGGGGGIGANQGATYNPSEAADILKSRFVDRSNALGVNLSNGSVSASPPVSLRVGTGGFPYELSASLAWNSAPPHAPGDPAVPTQPQPGLTVNWTNSLAMSSSGTEAMGSSEVRAAIGTIAAFLATQDIYKSAQSPQRDVAAVLVQSWWVNQISGNVVTVSHGTSTKQFIRLPTQQWIAPGAEYATLTQNGMRAPYEESCDGPAPYTMSRGWDYSNMSFDMTNTHGDTEHFAFWKNYYWTSTTAQCGVRQGFRLTTWTFPQGVTVSLTYGQPFNPYPGDGTQTGGIEQLLSVSNSLGRVINFTSGGKNINGFNNNLSGSDARTVSITRSGGYPTAVTDQMGKTWTYSLSTQTLARPYMPMLIGQIFSPRNTNAPQVRYVYDSLGRVAEADDANNIQLGNRSPHFFYIADGTRGERVDPLGNSFVVVYDTKSRPWRYIDELGRETDATYDGRGRVVSYVYPEHDCEVLGYDGHNNPAMLQRVDKSSSCNLSAGAGHVISISTNWDQTWNKPSSVTDAKGQTTSFTYYSSGNGTSLLHTATRPNGAVYSFVYNAFGKPVTATDPTNLVTSNTYDPTYGNLTTTSIDPSGANTTTTLTYDAQGDVITIDGPRSDVADISYGTFDLNRRPVFKIGGDPDGSGPHKGVTSKSIYDEEGHEIETDQGKASSPDGSDFTASLVVTATYDPVGNKIRVTTPTSVTQFSYDGDDRALCTAVRMNRDSAGVFGTLPSDACTLSAPTTFGPDRITQNIYDGAGQLRQIVRALGVSDPAGPQQVYASYKYSPNGKQIVVADANKIGGNQIGKDYAEALNENTASDHQTNYFYDGFDRLRTTMFADSSYEQLSYDDNGNVSTRRNRAGQMITYDYNEINLVRSKTVPAVGSIPANTVNWQYDLAGRIGTISDTLGNANTNAFDTMKRVQSTTVTIPGLSGTRSISYLYDAASNRTRLTWPDNYYVTYGYDAANRLVGANENGSAALAGYDYDDLGHPAWVQYAGTGAKETYTWSTEGDLLTLTHALPGEDHYVDFTDHYTPVHQISDSTISNAAFQHAPLAAGTDSYAANGLNQYANVNNGTAGAADCAGHAQQIGYDCNGNLTTDGVSTYTYDPENHLMTAAKTGTMATYAYDPDGRRTTKTVNSTATYFLSSGSDEIAELDGNGSLLRRYVPGLGIDQPIAMVTAAGAKTFFHQDKTGSIIAMTDTAGTVVEGPYTYDPFGNCVTGGQACSGGVPYKYTGRRYDPETGLYDYRARYYSAKIGRFLQTDPIGYEDGINWYAYVGNDPTDGTDPTGLDTVTCNQFRDILRCFIRQDDHPNSITFNTDKVSRKVNLYGVAEQGHLTDQQWAGEIVGYKNDLHIDLPLQLFKYLLSETQAEASFNAAFAVTQIELGRLQSWQFRNSEPTGSAQKGDPFHRGASWERDRAISEGRRESFRGNDGRYYTRVTVRGSQNGKSGTYEYIYDTSGHQTHQMFRPD